MTGGTVVSDYWNSTNTGVSAVVPISTTDPTLTDGTVQLQARSGSAGSWTSVGSESSITAAEAAAQTKTVTAAASGTTNVMDIEEIPAGSGAEVGDGKEFFFRVVMTDVAGNATNFNQSTSSPLQDQTVPTFTTITSSNDDKAYKILDTLLITPTMSEAVVVTGTPKFNLETGTSDGTAKYLSGSNSANLIFQYVVESGHTSSDLGYTSTNGFILDGGTVRDVAGNDLDLTTLPTAGAANSLKANKVIVIDTKLPFVTFTYDDPDTLVRFEDGTLNITATFSDSIQSDSIPKITIDFPGVTTGDVSAANMTRTSGTVFTYPLTLIDGSTGIITITISAYDKALNALPADSVFRGTAVTIDNTDPVFTLLSPDSNSYVNHAKVGYKLSETSFSGNVTWERIGGTVDANSPHIAILTASELDAATTFADYSLTNIPTSLVSGTTYSITWSATDTVGNVSSAYINTPIYYDTTALTAVLSYSHYFAREDTVVTITATFNERALPTPKIAIDYQGIDSDVGLTDMTIGSDSTVWTYAATIPGGEVNNGVVSVSVTTTDLAGNSLRASDITDTDTLVVDNTFPSAVITYSDSLVKENDNVTVTVTFNESVQLSPQIGIVYAGEAELDTVDMVATNTTIWTYGSVIIPDGNDGAATVSIIAKDLGGNYLTNANTTNRTLLRVDNTHPTFSVLSPDSNSYVNHAKVGYKLSETSFSGNVTWERIGGTVDANSPHIATLTASELNAATTFADYSLTNISTTLVTGTAYSITWSATDTAGNVSAAYISTPIYYDTTAPTAELTYSQYFATADSVVTITATFNERALPKPQIAINYQGEDRDVAVTNMTMGADSTIWIYAAKIPGGSANNGLASISITATDLAGNSLRTADLTGSDTLVVDNTAPSVTLTYDDPDTLVRFEDAILLVTATFSDSIPVDSIPKISVNMPSGTNGDISAGGMTLVSGKVYNYSLPLVDKADGIIAITVSAYDKALNAIVADSIFRGSVVTIDNTDPSAFTTGTITAMGDTIVVPWLNKETDSLRLLIPISATDESLLDGGDVNVQMRVTGKMTTDTWVTIVTSDASSPSAPADSIKQLSGNQTFFRKKEDIITSLKPLGLAQGDTIRIRGSINDKVGNITYGTQSQSFFVLDTLPPAQRPFFGDTLFTSNNVTSILTVNRDTLWTNDTIRFAFNNWVDSVKTNEKASGINRYEYALYQSTKATPDETNPKDWTKFRDYRSLALDTVRTDTFALTHNLKYYVALKAVDIAGNTSDTLNSFRTLRHNAYPIRS